MVWRTIEVLLEGCLMDGMNKFKVLENLNRHFMGFGIIWISFS